MSAAAFLLGLACHTVASDPFRSPENLPLSVAAMADAAVWCWADTEEGERLVFNYDEGRVLPELTALYQRDGAGRFIAVARGSRAKGVLRYVRSRYVGVDLLPVGPLPTGDKNASTTLGADAADALAGIVEALRAVDTKSARRDDRLEAGEYSYQLDESRFPYDAFWWPHADLQLAAGPGSPLGKYDAMVEARTGRNPGAAAWEARTHSLQNVPWGGHCNGWAASSVLYDETDGPRWDPVTQTVVSTSDFNGMLAEASFCVYWAFYGQRYNGREGDDITDIHADLFHKVLVQYLRDEQKPIAMDYVTGESVDNSVITGANIVVTAVEGEERAFRVHASLRIHAYGFARDESRGPAVSHEGVYSYILRVDEAGAIVSGEWEGGNPDFLWVPLAQRRCGRENPNLDADVIAGFMTSLPRLAPAQQIPLHLNISVELQPGETLALPLPPARSGIFRLNVDEGSAAMGLGVVARGIPRYPSLGNEGPSEMALALAGANAEPLQLQTLESLRLENMSGVPSGAPIRITSLDWQSGAAP